MIATGAAQEAAAPADAGTLYRFIERYSTEPTDKLLAGATGQYRVSIQQKYVTLRDNPRGAPERTERSRRMICRERPAEFSTTDPRQVLALVRRYESMQSSPDTDARPTGPKPFQDLSVWLKPRPAEPPLILVLTPDHPLTDIEFAVASRQVLVPNLGLLLPEVPIRVNGTWPAPRGGTTALLSLPIADGVLTGQLLEVRAEPNGPRKIATFSLTGKVSAAFGAALSDVGVNARVQFAFVPSTAPMVPADPNSSAPIDAAGAITRISLAYEATIPLDGSGRLHQKTRHELILDRQTPDPGPSLAIPSPAPEANVDNSWLTFNDRRGRFSMRHPQELELDVDPTMPDSINFVHSLEGSEPDMVVSVGLSTKAQLDPDKVRRDLESDWKASQITVAPGRRGWLPEADWPERKVYVLEAVLTPPIAGGPESPKKHFFDYIVLTGRDTGLNVLGFTTLDPPDPFRKQLEDLIRTIQFGPPKAKR
jgi:hypothetical protein